MDAVAWTSFSPKFNGVRGTAPSSADDSVNYLRQLRPGSQVRVREYVELAPAQARTQFRAVFETELGWLPSQGCSGRPVKTAWPLLFVSAVATNSRS